MADRTPADEDFDGAVGFLQRWSRRKRAGDESEIEPATEASQSHATAAPAEAVAPDAAGAVEDPDADDRIDPRTGKRFDELTDDDMPSVDALDQDADVSAFFAKGISQALRLAALRKLWHTPKFNQLDLMSEYSGNYNNYEKLGTIVPHDMKRAVDREIERARKRQEALEAQAREDAEARQAGAERDEETRADDRGEADMGQNDPGDAPGSGSDGPAGGSDEGDSAVASRDEGGAGERDNEAVTPRHG